MLSADDMMLAGSARSDAEQVCYEMRDAAGMKIVPSRCGEERGEPEVKAVSLSTFIPSSLVTSCE